jgi:hypothetical protein
LAANPLLLLLLLLLRGLLIPAVLLCGLRPIARMLLLPLQAALMDCGSPLFSDLCNLCAPAALHLQLSL